ncbi:hypothetical protein AABB24_029723, partial [Solanum stoloniferum]
PIFFFILASPLQRKYATAPPLYAFRRNRHHLLVVVIPLSLSSLLSSLFSMRQRTPARTTSSRRCSIALPLLLSRTRTIRIISSQQRPTKQQHRRSSNQVAPASPAPFPSPILSASETLDSGKVFGALSRLKMDLNRSVQVRSLFQTSSRFD